MQVEEQPSLSATFPSSHSSLYATSVFPFEHIKLQELKAASTYVHSNLDNNDGCSSTCQIETGYICDNSTSAGTELA
jgi:hypothetical protein